MNNDSCCSGHKQPDDKTEKKLLELEHSLPEKQQLPETVSSQDLIEIEGRNPAIKDDLYYFGGIGLIAFGLLALFQHIHVGTGLFQTFGLYGRGFGLLMLPLLAGIGLIVYNPKNKLGYFVLSLSIAVIFFGVLASLIMFFPTMSLLGLIIMLAPLALGTAFVIKGMGGPKSIEYKMREQGLIKSKIKSDDICK